MLKYLAKRIGRSILTLFVIVTLVFCLLRLMPVEGYFANYEKMTEAQIQAGLQSMGLLDLLPGRTEKAEGARREFAGLLFGDAARLSR